MNIIGVGASLVLHGMRDTAACVSMRLIGHLRLRAGVGVAKGTDDAVPLLLAALAIATIVSQ